MERRNFLKKLFGTIGCIAIGPAILISKPDQVNYTTPYRVRYKTKSGHIYSVNRTLNDVERSIMQSSYLDSKLQKTWIEKREYEFLINWEKQKDIALKTFLEIYKHNK